MLLITGLAERSTGSSRKRERERKREKQWGETRDDKRKRASSLSPQHLPTREKLAGGKVKKNGSEREDSDLSNDKRQGGIEREVAPQEKSERKIERCCGAAPAGADLREREKRIEERERREIERKRQRGREIERERERERERDVVVLDQLELT